MSDVQEMFPNPVSQLPFGLAHILHAALFAGNEVDEVIKLAGESLWYHIAVLGGGAYGLTAFV